MRHVGFFRWLLVCGLMLILCSTGLYWAAPDYPELRQTELTVLDEKPDGKCRVRWTDPFAHREREAPYQCDADRDEILKAPNYALVGGNISALNRGRGARAKVVRAATRLREAAALVAQDHGRAVEAVRAAWTPLHRELVDGELSRMPVTRLRETAGMRSTVKQLEKAGVRTVRDVLDAGEWRLGQIPGVGRTTAGRVMAAAQRIADEADEALAVRIDAARPEPRTTALVVALRALVEAGPGMEHAAAVGRKLTTRLDPMLADAAPAAGWKQMSAAGKEQRQDARDAVAELRLLLAEAQREGVEQQFAQASVDLLRGPDSGPAGLSAWVDFEARPKEYYSALAKFVGRGRPAGAPRRTGRSARFTARNGSVGLRRLPRW
ncbi:helix-hairpin-helix domain-containing protein [Streptomyces cyslabdanicus]|uniref:helix-hairpin-helix domain-containing protein n=1 Tax=Streptomyces cyslabdanicus TaxID=1470456 RepID=UPI004044A092